MTTPKQLRRIAVAVAGGTVLAIGAALLILPGPALVVIPVGLGILALEFAWARRWLRKARALFQQTRPGDVREHIPSPKPPAKKE